MVFFKVRLIRVSERLSSAYTEVALMDVADIEKPICDGIEHRVIADNDIDIDTRFGVHALHGGTSYMFNAVSEQMPLDAISTGSAFALIGCNLGASSISLVLKAITFIGTDKSTSFFCYAVVYLVLAIGVTAKAFLSKRK